MRARHGPKEYRLANMEAAQPGGLAGPRQLNEIQKE